jgi:hypothetical protein
VVAFESEGFFLPFQTSVGVMFNPRALVAEKGIAVQTDAKTHQALGAKTKLVGVGDWGERLVGNFPSGGFYPPFIGSPVS